MEEEKNVEHVAPIHKEGRFVIKNQALRTVVGVILVFVGILAFFTPLTPGSWLALIGLEMLGLHMAIMKPVREWLQRRGWWR